MKQSAELPENRPTSNFPADREDEEREAILLELDKILQSSFFRIAARSKQFLKFVVLHQVEGHSELLKERTIGTEVFLRPPGYATGDDPVVRVQAGEVRRRLDQYYRASPNDSLVRIELPVGSYSPVFHWPSTAELEPIRPIHLSSPASELRHEKRSLGRWAIGLGLAIAICSGIAFQALHRTPPQKSALEQFWGPVFSSPQPVLICLAKGVTYRPGPRLYQRYSRNHPGTFQTEVERSSVPLPLGPNERLSWNDLFLYPGYGVAIGDVSAAVKLSALLGKMGKPNQVRIGSNYSFEDLRNSPSVVVGAFNNKWTMEMTSNLHFAFVEENGNTMIREQIPGGRVWLTHLSKLGIPDRDFAIVARLLDSKTGQFIIAAAGIEDKGTQAAGEFVSNPEYLEEALKSAPAGWQTKNLEIVLQTPVTDSIAGPPKAVASYFW